MRVEYLATWRRASSTSGRRQRTRTKCGGVQKSARAGRRRGRARKRTCRRAENPGEICFFVTFWNGMMRTTPTPKTLTTRRHPTHLPNPEHYCTGFCRTANNISRLPRHRRKSVFCPLMTSAFPRVVPVHPPRLFYTTRHIHSYIQR
jgi:hypothetical protein